MNMCKSNGCLATGPETATHLSSSLFFSRQDTAGPDVNHQAPFQRFVSDILRLSLFLAEQIFYFSFCVAQSYLSDSTPPGISAS